VVTYYEVSIKEKKKLNFHERMIHPLLTYFASTNLYRGKQIFTKTILHELSKKSSLSEWVHPDMVGFYIPLEEWNEKLMEFNKLIDRSAIRLYSFEIKKHIDRSNYRECFFQTVSNSSWANEGYLVTCEIQQDDNLLAELERLSMSFGIGLIELNLSDFFSSRAVFPAKPKEILDWELMNKLCEQNSNFRSFIDNVRKDFTVNRINTNVYDELIKDPEIYIEEKMKK
jgi:uncharacterized protein